MKDKRLCTTRYAYIFVLLVVAALRSVEAATVLATWHANTESDLAGYRLHWGTDSRGVATEVTQFSYAHDQSASVSASPTATVTGLLAGVTYYFAVTARDLSGNVSLYSDEVPFAVPFSKGLGIAASWDDVEERPDGSMYMDSTDLELTEDTAGAQTIGLRFTVLDLPRGASIREAYVQFTVDEATTSSTSVQIRGELSGNARAFTTNDCDVTSRQTTSASVGWTVPGWPTVGAAGAEQRTPDLSAVIQEVVDRTDWLNGNALALLITGTGRRTAESYDGSVADAPALIVAYDTGIADDGDGDGMGDGWELAQFGGTNTASGAAHLDYDADGVANWAEFVAGTDPTAGGTSYFVCDVRAAGGQLLVTFPTVVAAGPGYTGCVRRYWLERSAASTVPVWTGVPDHTNIRATGGIVVFTNDFPGASFFRAKTRLVQDP